MADILKGLAGGGTTFLFAWILPSAIAIQVLVVTLLRRSGLDATLGVTSLAPTEYVLALGIAATGCALIMNALSTPMYRLLEGYSLPARIQRPLKAGELRRRRRIQRALAGNVDGVERGLLQEQLQRFPEQRVQTAPTRLGNALRAFETFSVDRYLLDSQLFWTELYSVVPDALRKELEVARSSVDFFVAATYLSVIVGLLEWIGGVLVGGGPDRGMLLVGAFAFALAPIWYRSAVGSTSYWASTVRALVYLGRAPLAEAMGLTLPDSIDAERKMWALADRFAYFGYEEGSAVRLDEFRSAPKPSVASPDQREC